ncbi:hypothetical protein CRG98_010270 [Punica granatum]|uniref:Uncharacterized protein n=1 Tax=Punica granatum TaxID=22663 RepID=A0A2I0KND4_PUNGR|nr:hypothetical protein CRG98_010270 [Punica granatum]
MRARSEGTQAYSGSSFGALVSEVDTTPEKTRLTGAAFDLRSSRGAIPKLKDDISTNSRSQRSLGAATAACRYGLNREELRPPMVRLRVPLLLSL